jgi:hypothetical protein
MAAMDSGTTTQTTASQTAPPSGTKSGNYPTGTLTRTNAINPLGRPLNAPRIDFPERTGHFPLSRPLPRSSAL